MQQNQGEPWPPDEVNAKSIPGAGPGLSAAISLARAIEWELGSVAAHLAQSVSEARAHAVSDAAARGDFSMARLVGCMEMARLSSERISAALRDLRELALVADEERAPTDLLALVHEAETTTPPRLRARARLAHEFESCGQVLVQAERVSFVVATLLTRAFRGLSDPQAPHNRIRLRVGPLDEQTAFVQVLDESPTEGASVASSRLQDRGVNLFVAGQIAEAQGGSLSLGHDTSARSLALLVLPMAVANETRTRPTSRPGSSLIPQEPPK